MKRVVRYLNPMAHLGEGNYSFLFPFITTSLLCVLSEVFSYLILKDPSDVGAYVIFLTVGLIIYFAFRDGIKGGLIATSISVTYFFYIVYSREIAGEEFTTAVRTIIILGMLFAILASIIGWLKQRIDRLIEREADEKKRLETIIQQLPVGIIITDEKGKVVQRNKRLDTMLGMKIPLGFTVGKDTFEKEIANGNHYDPSKSPLLYVLKTGKTILNKEYAYTRRDGKTLALQMSTTPIQNKKRKIIAAVSIITDITQQKELERQKDDFLSMASHELKTPLTSLKMFVDLQKIVIGKKETKKVKYYNERIKDQANRLKELTNDLLDVSRIQTGKLRFHHEEFDIAQVVQDTVEGFQETINTHEITIHKLESVKVLGDRYRIYQVLVNLLSNAVKYSSNGKKIVISVAKTRKEVTVSVKDFGIGIAKDKQEKIFERLYQVTDPQEKTFPGLGLGLYISKEIITSHHGKIWVTSTKGKGSTFFFSLPRQK